MSHSKSHKCILLNNPIFILESRRVFRITPKRICENIFFDYTKENHNISNIKNKQVLRIEQTTFVQNALLKIKHGTSRVP